MKFRKWLIELGLTYYTTVHMYKYQIFQRVFGQTGGCAVLLAFILEFVPKYKDKNWAGSLVIY